MQSSFTIYNQEDTFEYFSIDDIEDAAEYLTDPSSFRSFNIGLTELLIKKGYPGDKDNITELSEYLISKLRKINSSIGNETVISWFSGIHSPKVEAGSRNKIYEICFALELTYEETLWFFHHVYYDRAFNCHTIEEAVYYYCFLNGLSYQEAQRIIPEIEQAPAVTTNAEKSANYTQFVRDRIHEFESVAELKEFLIQNKENFNTWNESASKTLNQLVLELIGPPESKATIDKLKQLINEKRNKHTKTLTFDLADYQNCGLLIKELLFDSQDPWENPADSPAAYIWDGIKDRNIKKKTFILERILRTDKICRDNNKIQIPYIIRNNFPSRKTMSDVLSEDKISVSKSYDSIRKMIVLLDFYRFWANEKLKKGYTDFSMDMLSNLSETYVEETNACLYQCGYEELYAGNPYDWIFLSSARSENPLEYFRALIGEFCDIDNW